MHILSRGKTFRRESVFFFGIIFAFLIFLFPTSANADVLLPGNINTCGELAVPGAYTLTANISNGSSTCLVISSDNVVIDGGGYAISGTGAVAIDARARTSWLGGILTEGSHGYTNLIINKLNITGYTTGINLSGNSDTTGSGTNHGFSGDGGDVALYYSSVGSVIVSGGDSATKQYGGSGGNIMFTNTNLDISNITLSALGGSGTSGRAVDGGLDLNYTATLTKTNLVLSSLSFFNDNATEYGVYVGGTWPILPGSISTCGTLYGAGTFTLSQNITGISGTCFTIGTNNVTLDGAGYSITSATTSNSSYAVNASNFSNFTFASTTVVNFSNLVTASSTITISGSSLNLTSKKITAPNVIIQAETLNLASSTFVAGILDINYSVSVSGTSSASSTSALTSMKVNSLEYGPKTAGLLFINTWTQRTSDVTRPWNGIAMSADGVKLAATTQGDYIYISNDSGRTWVPVTSLGTKTWSAITSSVDGTKLAATENGGYVYISTDSGVTWARSNSPSKSWISIKSSADGKQLVAVETSTGGVGYVYTSIDSGVNWVQRISSGAKAWVSVACDGSCSKFVVVGGTYVYTSADNGITWATSTTALGSIVNWSSVSSSADGTTLVASVLNGYIYKSTNSGATWSTTTTSLGTKSWKSTTLSADGTKIAAVIGSSGLIYTSNDGGTTWVGQPSVGSTDWRSVISSADGSMLAAVSYNSYLYTYTTLTPTLSVDILSPQSGASFLTWSPIVSWGVSKYCYYSYDNFVSTTTADCSRKGSDIVAPPSGGNITLSVRGFGTLGSVTLTRSVNFNNYNSQDVLINSPIQNSSYGATVWSPSVDYSVSNVNLTLCQYSYDNFVSSTTTVDCSKNGSDISPPFDGYNTLYIRAIDVGNNVSVSNVSFTYTTSLITQSILGLKDWKSIASDSTGVKLVATETSGIGYVYTSTTTGARWTQTNAGQRAWVSVVSSEDGTKMSAAVNGGYVYTSTTSGATWVANSAVGTRGWTRISSSADGTKLAGVVAYGYIYTSTDSGATWATSTGALSLGSKFYSSIDSNYLGDKLVAAAGTTGVNDYIYVSTDYGINWATSTGAGSRKWLSVTIDSTGDKIAAVAYDGQIYTSIDGGTNWAVKGEKRYWRDITSSSDGNKLVAVENDGGGNGKIYTSIDGGTSWTTRGSAKNWTSVTSSSDGNKIAVVAQNSYIYTLDLSANDSYVNSYLSIISPVASSALTSFSWSPSVYWGFNKTTCQYSYNNFVSSTSTSCLGNGSDILPPSSDGANTLYIKSIDPSNVISTTSVAFSYISNGWAIRSSAEYWRSISSDLSGTKIYAGAGSASASQPNYIYASTDSGATWTALVSMAKKYWMSVVSSFDGVKIAAVSDYGYIYSSINSGLTWIERTSAGSRRWTSIASDVFGTKLIASVTGGYVYTSTDSGATWATSTSLGSKTWAAVASDASGTKLVAGVGDGTNGYLYTSTDSGATWATSTGAGSRRWTDIVSSSDGSKIIAVSGVSGIPDYIYISNNGGTTWASSTSAGLANWKSIASDSTGTRLVAVVNNGYTYTSNNGGTTWVQNSSLGTKYWYAISSSADGSKLSAAIDSGNIYTYTDSPRVLAIDVLLPQTGAVTTDWTPVVSWGTAVSCYYSYDNFTSTSSAACALAGSDILVPTTAGTNTLYIKGIDAGGSVVINSKTFNYSPHYWCGTADSNWSNINNWYTDNTCTVNKGSLPAITSTAFLVGSVSPIISSATTTFPLFINSTGLTGGANISGIIFSGSAYNTTRIIGNATYNTASAGTLTLTGTMKWMGAISGTIKGGDGVDIIHLIFNNSSSNEITIGNTISSVFNDGASNNGIINGDATFNNTSLFTMGTVNGTATLSGLSQTLNGINNVINLFKQVASAIRDTLFLTAGSTLNVSGLTTILGYDANNLLTIKSDTPGIFASIGINGTSTLNYLRIKDINNTGTNVNLATSTIIVFDDGGNTGFTFNSSTTPSQRDGMTSGYLSQGAPLFPGVVSSCENLYFPGTYTFDQDFVGDCNIASTGIILVGAGHTLNGNLTTNHNGVTLSNIIITGNVSSTGVGAGTITVNSASNLTGTTSVTGAIAGDGSSSLGNTVINTGGSVATSSVSFVGDVLNNGTIYSGNSVAGNITNNGTINGNFTFNNSSVNSGTINGNAIFSSTSINTGTVTGNARFNSITSFAGTMSFSGTESFAGTGYVNGNVYDSTGTTTVTTWIFNDSSSNNGRTKGNAVFNNSSTNLGIISGNANVYSPVVRPLGGTVDGQLIYNSYPAIYFNDTAIGHGVSGKWDDVLNWWTDSAFTIPSPVVPTSGDDVIIYGNITNTGVSALARTAIFESTSNNNITITLASTSTSAGLFNASSTNSGTISGNATFSGPDSDSTGTVTGYITRQYNAGIYTVTKDFTANGAHWIVQALSGAVVDLSNATYSLVTNVFQALNNSRFIWNNLIGPGAPELVITSPVAGTNIKWTPVVSWGTNYLVQYKIDGGVYTSASSTRNGADIPRPSAGSHTIYFKSTDVNENITEKSVSFTYDNTQPVDTDCSNVLDEATRPYYYLTANVTNNCVVTASTTIRGGDGLGNFYSINGNLTGDGDDIVLQNVNVTGVTSGFGVVNVSSSTLAGGIIVGGSLYSDTSSTFGSSTITSSGTVYSGVFIGDLINNGTIIKSSNPSISVLGSITNNGTINGDFVLNATSTNNGIINGNTTLNGLSLNGYSGSIVGTLTLSDTAINRGSLSGNLIFRGLTATSGWVPVYGPIFYGTGNVTGGVVKDSSSNDITGWVFKDGSTNAGVTQGTAIFTGSSTNSGTISGDAHFDWSSTNLGTVTGDADVYSDAEHIIITALSGIVNGTTTYFSYPNTISFRNITGDNDWGSSLNWFTDATFTVGLGRIPTSGENVVLFDSATLSANVTNNVYIASSSITLDGAQFTLTGNIYANGSYSNRDALDFNISNIKVVGSLYANGANNPGSVGGNGGRITIATSTTSNIFANGGNGSTNGGTGGQIIVSNSLGNPSSSVIQANGGNSMSCGNGGNAGQVTSTNSSYGTITNNAGSGSNSTCPAQTHSGGSSGSQVIVGVYTPPVVYVPPTSNNNTPAVSGGGGTVVGGSSVVGNPNYNIGELNLTNIPRVDFSVYKDWGVSSFRSPLAGMEFSLGHPTFGGMPKLNLSLKINSFLANSSVSSLINLSNAVPSIKRELVNANIRTGYELYGMKETPIKTPTLSQTVKDKLLQPVNLIFVSINGEERETKLSINKKGGIYQMITVDPSVKMSINVKNLDKKLVNVTFDNKIIKFKKDKNNVVTLEIFAPKVNGVYILKVGDATLNVTVGKADIRIANGTETDANSNDSWFTSFVNFIKKVWNWFFGWL